MMATATKRTASHAFSIDSLMSRDSRETSPISPPKSSSVTPPTSPSQNTAHFNAHLMSMKALYEANQYLPGLEHMAGLGLNHPIFAGALPTSLPGHMPSLPHLNPLLLAGAQRESLFHPWLAQLAGRHPSFLSHRFGKFFSSYHQNLYIYIHNIMQNPLPFSTSLISPY